MLTNHSAELDGVAQFGSPLRTKRAASRWSKAVLLATSGWLSLVCVLSSVLAQEPDDHSSVNPAATAQVEAEANDEARFSGTERVGQVFRARATEIEASMVVIESFGGATVASGQIGGLRAQGEGNTTGLVVDESGLILTSSFNFVGQPPVVTVLMGEGERYVARMVAQDFTRNLCLLRIQGVTGLKVPNFAPTNQAKLGQWVAALGTGYGDRVPAMTIGIVSAVGRASGRAIQTDANTSPANYGGPLIDLEGNVLGLCVPLNPSSPGPAAGVEWYDSGIGFAIPIDFQADWWQRLKSGENIEFGFLGIEIAPAESEALPAGVKVNSVVEAGPAAQAGVVAEDRLLKIGGVDVIDTGQFGVELRRYHAGEQLELLVQRGDSQETLVVTLGRNPNRAPEIAPVQQPLEQPSIEPAEPDGDQ